MQAAVTVDGCTSTHLHIVEAQEVPSSLSVPLSPCSSAAIPDFTVARRVQSALQYIRL